MGGRRRSSHGVEPATVRTTSVFDRDASRQQHGTATNRQPPPTTGIARRFSSAHPTSEGPGVVPQAIGLTRIRRNRLRPKYEHGCGGTGGRKLAGYCPGRKQTRAPKWPPGIDNSLVH